MGGLRTLADLTDEYLSTGGLSRDDFARYRELRRQEYTEARRKRNPRR
jgi:hypothetical protein